MIAVDTLMMVGTVATVVGALAALAGLWGVFRRFRPKFTAKMDGPCQAIRLDVKNAGRNTGRINDVAVVDQDLVELPCEFAGLASGFHPVELSGAAAKYLIIAADRTTGPFSTGVRVRVEWGRRRSRVLEPERDPEARYYGLQSDW